MKNLFLKLSGMGLLSFMLMFSACNNDPCEEIACLNGGVCVDGTCECPDGYSGDLCQNLDPCHNIECLNSGVCIDGTCDCPDGYSGDLCQNYDPCHDVECGDNEICFDGICDCMTGYEGTLCDTQWSEKFLGSYIGQDVCNGWIYTNIATNITSSSATTISMSNFAGLVATMTASLETPTKVQINNPNFLTPDGTFAIIGSGEISGNVLTINYTLNESSTGLSLTCALTYIKQ